MPSHVTCFNCGNKGHVASQCRRPKKKEVIEIDVLDSDEPVNDAASTPDYDGNKDSLNPYPRGPLPEIYSLSDKPPSRNKQQQRSDRIVSGTVIEGGIQIPVLLNGRREYALLDTGANVSAINGDVLSELAVPVVQRDGILS